MLSNNSNSKRVATSPSLRKFQTTTASPPPGWTHTSTNTKLVNLFLKTKALLKSDQPRQGVIRSSLMGLTLCFRGKLLLSPSHLWRTLKWINPRSLVSPQLNKLINHKLEEVVKLILQVGPIQVTLISPIPMACLHPALTRAILNSKRTFLSFKLTPSLETLLSLTPIILQIQLPTTIHHPKMLFLTVLLLVCPLPQLPK